MARRAARLLALLSSLVLVASSAACSTDRRNAEPDASPATGPVVVASFNFPESELLAEIYAQALEAAGVPVRRELGLGPRELVLPALQQGKVDVVPEYVGSALTAVRSAPTPAAQTSASALGDLRAALSPWQLRVLRPALAQDQNGFAVTSDMARQLSLHTVSDLVDAAGRMKLAGPFECRVRAFCLPGLARVYGVRFGQFLPLDSEDQRATALTEGVVDVAVMFTTDGRLASGDIVLLDDDRKLQPPENVVPVVRDVVAARYAAITPALDAVSAKLTTRSLAFLNWRTAVAHRDVADEARAWLRRQGLTPAHR